MGPVVIKYRYPCTLIRYSVIFFANIILKNKLSSAVVMLNDLGDHWTLPLNFSMRDYLTDQVYATPPTNLLDLHIVLKILAIVRYLPC